MFGRQSYQNSLCENNAIAIGNRINHDVLEFQFDPLVDSTMLTQWPDLSEGRHLSLLVEMRMFLLAFVRANILFHVYSMKTQLNCREQFNDTLTNVVKKAELLSAAEQQVLQQHSSELAISTLFFATDLDARNLILPNRLNHWASTLRTMRNNPSSNSAADFMTMSQQILEWAYPDDLTDGYPEFSNKEIMLPPLTIKIGILFSISSEFSQSLIKNCL